MILIGFTLLTLSCGQEAGLDATLEEVADRPSSSGMTLKTDQTTYTQGDNIILWVENRTDNDLWFVNDNFGVRGYSYDTVKGGWREADLGNQIINPQPWKVAAHHLLDANVGNLDTDFFTQLGQIRLVVYGCLGLEQLDGDCADYVAFRDITVEPRQ